MYYVYCRTSITISKDFLYAVINVSKGFLLVRRNAKTKTIPRVIRGGLFGPGPVLRFVQNSSGVGLESRGSFRLRKVLDSRILVTPARTQAVTEIHLPSITDTKDPLPCCKEILSTVSMARCNT